MKKYKSGLVLSGGGTRGFAHLGVFAALAAKGMQPDVISGVSVGAIAGAFLASGRSPAEIMKLFNKGWLLKYTKTLIPVNGFFRLDGLKKIIDNEIEAKNIEDLKIPFYVGVSNLNKGTVEYINKGSISEWVLASASIPVLFKPVQINNCIYADGGIMDNIPIEPIKNDCDRIIVVNITPLNSQENLKNMIQIATRTFYMNVNANKNEVSKYATIYIEPEGINRFDILGRGHAKELFDIGYQAVMKAEF